MKEKGKYDAIRQKVLPFLSVKSWDVYLYFKNVEDWRRKNGDFSRLTVIRIKSSHLMKKFGLRSRYSLWTRMVDLRDAQLVLTKRLSGGGGLEVSVRPFGDVMEAFKTGEFLPPFRTDGIVHQMYNFLDGDVQRDVQFSGELSTLRYECNSKYSNKTHSNPPSEGPEGGTFRTRLEEKDRRIGEEMKDPILNTDPILDSVRQKRLKALSERAPTVTSAIEWFRLSLRDYYPNLPQPYVTAAEKGMLKALIKALPASGKKPNEYIELAIKNWARLRSIVVWEDSGKPKLTEYPTVRDLCLSREAILIALSQLESRATPKFVTYTRIEDLPEGIHNREVLENTIRSMGYVTIRQQGGG